MFYSCYFISLACTHSIELLMNYRHCPKDAWRDNAVYVLSSNLKLIFFNKNKPTNPGYLINTGNMGLTSSEKRGHSV